MDITELSHKQLISVLCHYNNLLRPEKLRMPFTDYVKNYCIKSKPWHENADVIVKKGDTHTHIIHAFYWLYESEEKEVIATLKEKLNKIASDV